MFLDSYWNVSLSYISFSQKSKCREIYLQVLVCEAFFLSQGIPILLFLLFYSLKIFVNCCVQSHEPVLSELNPGYCRI